jgi:very-short-patch-repair endonuclease
MAIRRSLPTAAVFSGRTAAWLHGLDLAPGDPVEVTIPSGNGVSARAGLSVRRAEIAGEVVVRRGVPTTSILRTAIDLGSRPPLVEAVVAVDMALHARLVDLTQLREYIDAHPRHPGIAHLRRVVDVAEPASESAMETRLRLLLVLAGLPRPRAQVALHDERGRFLGRSDLYYPAQRLGLEYDGSTHRASLVEDNRRQNRLQDAGYRLLRFTAADISRAPDAVVALVARQLR